MERSFSDPSLTLSMQRSICQLLFLRLRASTEILEQLLLRSSILDDFHSSRILLLPEPQGYLWQALPRLVWCPLHLLCVMIRLILVVAPAACVLAAISISEIIRKSAKSIRAALSKRKADAAAKEAEEVSAAAFAAAPED